MTIVLNAQVARILWLSALKLIVAPRIMPSRYGRAVVSRALIQPPLHVAHTQRTRMVKGGLL
jgi:hypothetical protein